MQFHNFNTRRSKFTHQLSHADSGIKLGADHDHHFIFKMDIDEFWKLMDSDSHRAVIVCSVCNNNFISKVTTREYDQNSLHPLVKDVVERYAESLENCTVEMRKCPHKFHMPCFVQHSVGKMGNLWVCPNIYCTATAHSESDFIINDRRLYQLDFRNEHGGVNSKARFFCS